MERPIKTNEDPGNVDLEVPKFGDFTIEQLKQSPPREKELVEIRGPEALQSLKKNALNRALHFAYGVGDLPPVHFPNAEQFQATPFTYDQWDNYGNLESEYSRINFMIDNYEVRRFPFSFDPIVKNVLASPNVLKSWGNHLQKIDEESRQVYEDISSQMKRAKKQNGYHKGGELGTYETDLVFYEVSKESGELENNLWEISLSQITLELEEGDFGNLYNFINLYRRIKDPITPIKFNYLKQAEIFKTLYQETISVLEEEGIEISHENQKVLVAQLALESSFFALPGAGDIASVSYFGPHELPFIFVDVAEFPRGELANPVNVITIFHDLITESEKKGKAHVTPIAVSYFHDPSQKRPELFIIDGNNRSTAILLMKFINFVDFDQDQIKNYHESLPRFTTLYDLDIEWERDLSMALGWLFNPEAENRNKYDFGLDTLLSSPDLIKDFANSYIPALLVQESSFHTVAVTLSEEAKPKVILLQPMHQAIYNQRQSRVSIPSKQQSHGRVAGNKFMQELRSEIAG